MLLSSVGTEPLASTMCFALSVSFLPSCAVNSTLRPASSLPWPCSAVTPALLSSMAMPVVLALTMPVLRFCICATSNCTPLDLDAVDAELVFGLVIELARFEQRLGGDAAGIRAGAAEHGRAVLVLPLVDAGHLELVLRGANGGGITRRTATNDDHVVLVAHRNP